MNAPNHVKHRTAVLALLAAGIMWGCSVALSKLSLGWLDPAWLTALRFLVVAPVLAAIGWGHIRRAFSWRVALSGAIGYGLTILLQNAGIDHTSVSHAAILVGGIPIAVALINVGLGRRGARPMTWAGYGIALLGIVFVARGGGGATATGDGLVLASALTCAGLLVVQPKLLRGQDAAAVTTVQFVAAAALSIPVALITSGLPHGPTSTGPVVAFIALAFAGTVVPFWLFAYGQQRTLPELAGAMINVEPLVGAIVGWVAFSDPVGLWQISGAVAVVIGILLSVTPWERVSGSLRLAREARQDGNAVDTGLALVDS